MLSVIVVTIGLWLTSKFHGITVAGVSAAPLVVLALIKILKGDDIRALPWDSLLLVAGGLSLGLALLQTGLMEHYVNQLSQPNIKELTFLFIFAFLTMVFSNILRNNATSRVLIPLGMAILVGLKSEVALIVILSASTTLFLPVSTPPNAVAYGSGIIEQKDFRLGGLLIRLLGPALVIFWVILVS